MLLLWHLTKQTRTFWLAEIIVIVKIHYKNRENILETVRHVFTEFCHHSKPSRTAIVDLINKLTPTLALSELKNWITEVCPFRDSHRNLGYHKLVEAVNTERKHWKCLNKARMCLNKNIQRWGLWLWDNEKFPCDFSKLNSHRCARLSDLIHFRFFLWGCVKDPIYAGSPGYLLL